MLINTYLPFIDDDLIIIAEDKNHNAIGIVAVISDTYQKIKENKITRARLIILGVLPEYHSTGVATSMGVHLLGNLMNKGYEMLEASWVLEKNIPPLILAKKFLAKSGRVFALFWKIL